jgi:hypothetical protein
MPGQELYAAATEELVAAVRHHVRSGTPDPLIRAAWIDYCDAKEATKMDKTADQELAAARAELAGQVPEVQDVLERQEEHDADRR